MKTIKILSSFISIFWLNIGLAQITEIKLIPNDPQSVVSFGFSVALDSNILVVGAAESNNLGAKSGAAVVCENNNGNWQEDTVLLAIDGTSPARFGWAVDVQDNYIFIGADRDPENGIWSGAVYIYKFDSTSNKWTHHQKIFPNDIGAGHLFGSSVSISGSNALIGARGANDNVGAAYIYKNTGLEWVQDERLDPVNYTGDDPGFGISVGLDDEYAIVGAYYDDSGGNKSGAAFIFHYDGNDWIQQEKLLSADISPGDNFGYSVSISDDFAIVGSVNAVHETYRSGAAYIFKRSDSIWPEQVKLLDSTSTIDIAFGYSVSLLGDYAIIGVSQDNENGNNAGAAYVYKRNNSNWSKISKLIASDGNESDRYGWSVDIDVERVVVGAPIQDAGGFFCGAAYLYDELITGLNENQNKVGNQDLATMKIYPNPASSNVSLQSSVSGQQFLVIEIYDLNGRKLLETHIPARPAGGPKGSETVEVDVSNLESGIYCCKVSTDKKSITKKIIIQK